MGKFSKNQYQLSLYFCLLFLVIYQNALGKPFNNIISTNNIRSVFDFCDKKPRCLLVVGVENTIITPENPLADDRAFFYFYDFFSKAEPESAHSKAWELWSYWKTGAAFKLVDPSISQRIKKLTSQNKTVIALSHEFPNSSQIPNILYQLSSLDLKFSKVFRYKPTLGIQSDYFMRDGVFFLGDIPKAKMLSHMLPYLPDFNHIVFVDSYYQALLDAKNYLIHKNYTLFHFRIDEVVPFRTETADSLLSNMNSGFFSTTESSDDSKLHLK